MKNFLRQIDMKIFSRLVTLFLAIAIVCTFSTTYAKNFKLYQVSQITSIEKGARPAPEKYLSKRFIRKHLEKFRDGVSIVMGLESYNKYVRPAEKIGRADGCFVMPKYICDELDEKYPGNISMYETSLSFDVGYFSKQGGMVRIDVFEIDDLNLRIPSGNEEGANEYWLPGGFTRGGIPEAVVDQIPKDRIKVTFY